MKTLTLSLLSLSCLGFSVNVQSVDLPDNIKIYGKAELALSHADSGVAKRVDQGDSIRSVFSRLGVKGGYELTPEVKLLFTYEWEVKGFDEANKEKPFSARNTWLGVQTRFGSLLFGRNDTRFKKSEGNIDPFKEREANLKQIFAGQDRIGDTVTYISPEMAGFQLGSTLILGDDTKNDSSKQGDQSGYSLSLTYGDCKLKHNSYYLAAALNKDVLGIDAWRVLGQVDLHGVTLGAMYQSAENSQSSGKGFMVNGVVPLTLGLDYLFTPKARVYLMATSLELESRDDKVASLGLRYDF